MDKVNKTRETEGFSPWEVREESGDHISHFQSLELISRNFEKNVNANVRNVATQSQSAKQSSKIRLIK